MSEYIIPTDARAEYRKIIQRANRRILSNLKYVKEEGIRDHSIKTSLVGDFSSKKKWSTPKSPLSSSTKFKSEQDFKQFMRFVNRWGEDTGTRGGFKADPKRKLEEGKEAIYGAIFGLAEHKGTSLEEWGGDVPEDIKKAIDGMSLEQMSRFFDHVDEFDELFDSDQVESDDVEDLLDYIRGRISAVKKFYPRPEKRVTKKKKKRKSRRKTKGRKKK